MNKKLIFLESIIQGLFAFFIISCCINIINDYLKGNFVISNLFIILSVIMSSTLGTSFNLFFIRKKYFFNRKYFLIMNAIFVIASILFLPFVNNKYLLLFVFFFMNFLYLFKYVYLYLKSPHT